MCNYLEATEKVGRSRSQEECVVYQSPRDISLSNGLACSAISIKSSVRDDVPYQ